MRLLNASKLVNHREIEFKVYPDYNRTPYYAILSHRWGEDELTYQQACNVGSDGPNFNLQGHKKVMEAAVKALEYQLEWIWCDTCCIDKLSSAELSEAINSMFRWYQHSSLCIAYLFDISDNLFTTSEWFTRAWTLQELIAPMKLVFLDQDWQPICSKHDRIPDIADRTRIDREVLEHGPAKLKKCSVAQRMSWAADRVASRIEDVAYSLLGLFDVNMPMLYGEREKAFIRLQEEIIRRDADQTIFAWLPPEADAESNIVANSLFAPSPKTFQHCSTLAHDIKKRKPFAINNLGLEIEVTLRPFDQESYIANLPITNSYNPWPPGLKLDSLTDTHLFYRVAATLRPPRKIYGPHIPRSRRIIVLREHPVKRTSKRPLYGFRFSDTRHNLALVNGWDRERTWDLGTWMPESQPNDFRFRIVQGVSASIATLTLNIEEDVFLIQLAYDFDFNPCCRLTKLRTNLREYFGRRMGGLRLDENGTEWIYDEGTDWNDNLRFIEKYDQASKSWVARSIDHQNFETDVPVSITRSINRPTLQISVSFTNEIVPNDEELSTAWRFAIKSNSPMLTQAKHENGSVSIVDLRGNGVDESTMMMQEEYPTFDRPKRIFTFDSAAIERLSKRVDTSPL